MNPFIVSDLGNYLGDFEVLAIQRFFCWGKIRKEEEIAPGDGRRFLEFRHIEVRILGDQIEFIKHPMSPINYGNWDISLARACLSGCVELVWAVMKHRDQDGLDWEGDNVWFRGLEGACISGKLELVKLILEQMTGVGHYRELSKLMSLARKAGKYNVVEYFINMWEDIITASDW
jgi:hypothetical protein